jgi:hypothetical protein
MYVFDLKRSSSLQFANCVVSSSLCKACAFVTSDFNLFIIFVTGRCIAAKDAWMHKLHIGYIRPCLVGSEKF